MTYTTPTPSTVANGDQFQASSYNIISADIQDHQSRITSLESVNPHVRAIKTIGGVALPGDGFIPFESSTNDTDTMWSLSDPTKITFKTAGIYLLSAYTSVTSTTVGMTPNVQDAELYLNIGTVIAKAPARFTSTSYLNADASVLGTVVVSVGDYARVKVVSFTGSLVVNSSCFFEATRIGKVV